jgi:hypothetical protein
MINIIIEKAWALYFMIVMFVLVAVYWLKKRLQEKKNNEK